MNLSKIENGKPEQVPTNEQNADGRTENETCGVGAYCQCGGIIYACTDEHYKSSISARKEFENYIKNGFRVGRISKKDVQVLWGCKCEPELF